MIKTRKESPRHNVPRPFKVGLKDGTELIYECTYDEYKKVFILLKWRGEI